MWDAKSESKSNGVPRLDMASISSETAEKKPYSGNLLNSEPVVEEVLDDRSRSSPEGSAREEDSPKARSSAGVGASEDLPRSKEYYLEIMHLLVSAIRAANSQEEQAQAEYADLVRRIQAEVIVPDLNVICGAEKAPGYDTLLHKATAYGANDVVELLLQTNYLSFVDAMRVFPDTDDESPLTLAVKYANQELVDLYLRNSEHKVNALCAAIREYEESRADHAEDSPQLIESKRLLDKLLLDPSIVGHAEAKNESCLNERGWLNDFTPLQLLSHYCDRDYFIQVLRLLPSLPKGDNKAGNLCYTEQTDRSENTIVHIAVGSPFVTTDRGGEFLQYLLEPAYLRFWELPNSDGFTPLSILCSKDNTTTLLRRIAESKLSLVPEKVGPLVTPLHAAADKGLIDVIDLLLTLWPAEQITPILHGNIIQQSNDSLPSPFHLALSRERESILGGKAKMPGDATSETSSVTNFVAIQERLIAFVFAPSQIKLRDSFFDQQFDNTKAAIKKLENPKSRRRMMDMFHELNRDYSQLSTKYQFTIDDPNEFQSAITRINKILGILDALENLAHSFSTKSQLSREQKNIAKDEFVKYCDTKLYSDNLWALFTAVVCAVIGMLVGGAIGFVAGTFVTGGGPGGLWLAPPALKYGALVGASLGSVLGGAAGGLGHLILSDSFALKRCVWGVNWALKNDSKQSKTHSSEELVTLVSTSDSGGSSDIDAPNF